MRTGRRTGKWAVSILNALIALALAPASTAAEFLYVHNTYSGDLSKISIPEHEVVATIPIGLYMDYVIAAPDQQVLYVNRIETLGAGRAPNIGTSGELIALSTTTNEILWRMNLDGMPHHMAVSKDGKQVFVPYYDTWWLAVIDVEKREIVKKVFAGHGSHGTRLSPDGKRLYIGSMMYDTLSILDTETLTITTQIPFQQGVRPFVFPADESIVYVQQSRIHGFDVVDLKTKTHIKRVNLPPLPDDVELPQFYPHNVNHGIELSPDESLLFVNASIADYVAVYTHPTLDLKTTIPVGREPNAIKFNKNGQFAYVSNRRSDEISVISVPDLKEIKRIQVGKYPQRMAVVSIK